MSEALRFWFPKVYFDPFFNSPSIFYNLHLRSLFTITPFNLTNNLTKRIKPFNCKIKTTQKPILLFSYKSQIDDSAEEESVSLPHQSHSFSSIKNLQDSSL